MFDTTEARELAERMEIDARAGSGNCDDVLALVGELRSALDHIEQLQRGIAELESLSSSESLTFSYKYQRMPLIDVVLKLAKESTK